MKIFILEDNPDRMKFFNKNYGTNGMLIEWIDNAKDAITYLKENYATIDMIFLDHDLGGKTFVSSNEYNTGFTVAKFMNEHFYGNFKHVVIHSMNPPAAMRMRDLLPGSIVIPFHFLKERLDLTIKE